MPKKKKASVKDSGGVLGKLGTDGRGGTDDQCVRIEHLRDQDLGQLERSGQTSLREIRTDQLLSHPSIPAGRLRSSSSLCQKRKTRPDVVLVLSGLGDLDCLEPYRIGTSGVKAIPNPYENWWVGSSKYTTTINGVTICPEIGPTLAISV